MYMVFNLRFFADVINERCRTKQVNATRTVNGSEVVIKIDARETLSLNFHNNLRKNNEKSELQKFHFN